MMIRHVFFLLLPSLIVVQSFLPTRIITAPTRQQHYQQDGNDNHNIWTPLLAAKRGGGSRGGAGAGGGGPSKKKKKATNSSGGKQKKNEKGNSMTPKATSTKSRASQMNNNKKQGSHAPPWQVVSKKDMAKNVQAEKQRRELAQKGIHNVKEEIEYKRSKSFLSNEDKALLAWKRFALSPQDDIDFIGAYLNKQLPPRLGAPEVAFLGRSNVGKSSLLNKLVGSSTARVGKTPGATASVNLYGVFSQNDKNNKALMGLVDLPGFGYAKLSKETKESVQMAAENYLGKRKELVLGVLLVDIRRVPSEDDRAVLAAMYDMGVPLIVVATKVDKLSPTQVDDQLETIRKGLGLPEGQPFSVSSTTGQGTRELWRIIMEACETGVQELRTKMEQGKEEEQDNADVDADADEVFSDDEDVVYNQGFDWIQDSASVMYEDELGEDYVYEGDEDDSEDVVVPQQNVDPSMGKLNIKFLRQKAKKMEKRGEL